MKVPVRWRALSMEETGLVEKGMGGSLLTSTTLSSPIDDFLEEAIPGSAEEQLYQSLRLINSKLDFIIAQLFSRSTKEQYSADQIIEISGAGLKLISQESPPVGQLLKMYLIAIGTLQYETGLIAEVLRVEKKDDLSVIAAKIVEIDEQARESLIKVVFQKQRREIRREKMQRRENAGG
jgi:hypothetical protein